MITMLDIDDIEKRIQIALETIRVYLKEDEGDIEFVRFEADTNIAEVRFKGRCKDCPLVIMTLRAGVERYLIKAVPEIERVEAV